MRQTSPPSDRLTGLRLLSKSEVLDITGVTFPTVWAWMRAGTFPRSRVAGGKSVWRSDEVDAWLGALPLRKLKGDTPETSDTRPGDGEPKRGHRVSAGSAP